VILPTDFNDLDVWLDNHFVRGAHLRFFSREKKTKKTRRYDKNNLLNHRAFSAS